MIKHIAAILCLGFVTLPLGGCAALMVADAAVSTAAFAGKTAVKTTVGAGKLVAKGVGATARAVTPDFRGQPQNCYTLPDGSLDCVDG